MRPIANPPNPWSSTEVDYLGEVPPARLEVFEDRSRSILSENDSPDLGFRFSVNPYRGCYHGCAYCYARPTHEYLSFGAGTDFERKIVTKPEAPALLREAFERPSWRGDTVVFSGATDCYQPLEASYRLTRACLEVCLEYRNPVSIITKSPLIERDLDLLGALHREAHLRVAVSVPLWDEARARAVEPYVATPARRIRTVERLAGAGLTVGVMVAPLIPGLGDQDLAKVLAAAAGAGAVAAGWAYLRLPTSVRPVFEERLREAMPLRADRILGRVREGRGGKLYDSRYGVRLRGEGEHAAAIEALFVATCRKLGLDTAPTPAAATTFRRPGRPGDQLSLL